MALKPWDENESNIILDEGYCHGDQPSADT